EAAPLELIRDQRPVTVQHSEPFEAVERMPPHPAGGKVQLAPDRLGEEGRDARPDALEDEVLHLRRGPAAENARERFAQLLAVREVSGLVLEVDAQHGREQRLARLCQQRRHQRGGRPLEDHLADEQLHLRRGARLDGVERRPQLVAGGIQDARLLREIPLQGEIVLRFLLRHHGEKLAVGRPLARRQHHHLGHELLAAALAREQVREMKAGLAEDERPPLRNAHGAEGPEPLREEALLRERFALRVHLEMPGQLVERPRMAERGIDQGCHPVHALTAGRDTATVVPRPGSLSTRTVPCCAATSSWTMERPSPVPEPGGLVVKKGSKIRERFSLVIPQPLSMTESSTRSPFWEAAIRTSPCCGSTACSAL